jgi:restriction-modification enzyme MmeI-like protein
MPRRKSVPNPSIATMTETPSEVARRMAEFRDYTAELRGDERGEAQVFLERLFRAFGHDGYKAAGAVLEDRVRAAGQHVKFADLVWENHVLIEMKKRGERLARHHAQVFDYWIHLVPGRPRYVILCNFDEFWIYDFNVQLDEPIDRLSVKELPGRFTALNFLFPDRPKPLFNNNRTEVTEVAASKVGELFRALTKRGEPEDRAQRFVLQAVVAMFAEDISLLKNGLFTELVNESYQPGASSYDSIGGLFHQMNNRHPAPAGR